MSQANSNQNFVKFTERHWKEYLKALLAGVVTLASYLVGILTGDQTLSDVTFVQWLGAVIFLGGSFGITYKAVNQPHINTRLRNR